MRGGGGRNAYAGTAVPVARSQEAIRELLQRHKASGVNFSEDWIGNRVGFQFVMVRKREAVELPLLVKMVIPIWKKDTDRLVQSPERTNQRRRQVWRALFYYLKSQLEAVEFGLRTFEDAFLSDIEMQDGRTLGDHVRQGLDSGRLALPERSEVRR